MPPVPQSLRVTGDATTGLARLTPERTDDVSNVAVTIALVLLFILIGGFFAAAEMAMVSLRESQIRRLSREGRRGARVQKLARDPNRFLSAIQVGVTVATVLSAALGADALGPRFAPVLESWGMRERDRARRRPERFRRGMGHAQATNPAHVRAICGAFIGASRGVAGVIGETVALPVGQFTAW